MEYDVRYATGAAGGGGRGKHGPQVNRRAHGEAQIF
jgi:hypothetical protein